MSIWDDITQAASSAGSAITSPTGEEILSAVPALIGGFEAARGRPIGAPLTMLGQWGLEQGANRKASAKAMEQAQASTMGQLQTLAARFPNDRSLTNANNPMISSIGDLARNDPSAASNQISAIYNEHLADENAAKAQQEERIKMGQARPNFDKAGRAWRYNPATDRTERSPDDDIKGGGAAQDAKSFQSLWIKKYQAEHPNADASDVASAWHNQDISGKLGLINSMPWLAAKNAANKHIIDSNTGEEQGPNLSFGQVNAGIAAGKYSVITDKEKEALDNIDRVGTELQGMVKVMPKVLNPAIKGQTFKTWAQTMANRYRIPFLAKAGSSDATAYEAYRTAMALQMQQILTNSTRPVAVQEMGLVIPGVDPRTDMKTLTMSQLVGIVPSQQETMNTAWTKMQGIDKLLRTKRKSILGNAGKSFLTAPTVPGDTEITEPDMPAPESAGDDVSF